MLAKGEKVEREPINLDRFHSRMEVLVGRVFPQSTKKQLARNEETPFRTFSLRRAVHLQIQAQLASLGDNLLREADT